MGSQFGADAEKATTAMTHMRFRKHSTARLSSLRSHAKSLKVDALLEGDSGL